jgi:cytochrome c peroxidase
MGFDDREIVALLGAHCLGRCHTDRSGYKGPWTRAPTMVTNQFYQVNDRIALPTSLSDTIFSQELLNNQWTKKKWNGPEQYQDPSGELMMTPADLSLIKDPKFRQYVELYAKNDEIWFQDFAKAFGKLLALGVKFPEQKQQGWFSGWFK